MRLVLVNCAFESFAGPEELLARYHSLTGWAEALAGAGAQAVTVVQRFSRDAVVRRGGVEYRFVDDGAPPYPSPWFVGRRVAGIVAELAPTVVDVKGLVFPMVVRHLRAELPQSTAILVRDHGGFGAQSPAFRSWHKRAFYRFGLRAADGFLFTAPEQATPWLRAGIIGQRRAVHALPEASSDLAASFGPAQPAERLPGAPALLWVGRLESNKDPLTALAGFAAAARGLPRAVLTMVYGEDDLLPEVRARIAADPLLRDRVRLAGRLERRALAALYAGADLFVLGSHHEVACFSLLEALSFGIVPVVTDIPPFRALTDGGRLGALFPPGNADELARALREVAAGDLAARRRLVREHFDRELSWPAVGRRALEVYRGAAASRRTTA